MSTVKTSVSINSEIWEKLKNSKNRSQIINQSLSLYYNREDFLKKHLEEAEKAYWDNVHFHLENETGEYFHLNEPGQPLTQKDLDEKLWT